MSKYPNVECPTCSAEPRLPCWDLRYKPGQGPHLTTTHPARKLALKAGWGTAHQHFWRNGRCVAPGASADTCLGDPWPQLDD